MKTITQLELHQIKESLVNFQTALSEHKWALDEINIRYKDAGEDEFADYQTICEAGVSLTILNKIFNT